MLTIAKVIVVVLWSVALCTSTLAETLLTSDQLNKVVKQCVAAVREAPSETGMGEFYRKFDAYYNSRTGKVENNVATVGDQKAFLVFKKCMAEKGLPLA